MHVCMEKKDEGKPSDFLPIVGNLPSSIKPPTYYNTPLTKKIKFKKKIVDPIYRMYLVTN